ncbi:Hypothetical predicted protein [Octopus vulgaris]|uniref:Uncharacterized protein n=1 Tax=Octopus vulgaris TaxID=6645 RepID=A0AA36B289_OCTVU|nr:Hypothetical predicted protein [Octopus vulgaris]
MLALNRFPHCSSRCGRGTSHGVVFELGDPVVYIGDLILAAAVAIVTTVSVSSVCLTGARVSVSLAVGALTAVEDARYCCCCHCSTNNSQSAKVGSFGGVDSDRALVSRCAMQEGSTEDGSGYDIILTT